MRSEPDDVLQSAMLLMIVAGEADGDDNIRISPY